MDIKFLNLLDLACQHHKKPQFDWEDWDPIDPYLKSVKDDPPKDFSLATLDSYQNKEALLRMFAALPTEELVKEFGADILLWAWRYEYPLTSSIDGFTSEDKDLLTLINSFNRQVDRPLLRLAEHLIKSGNDLSVLGPVDMKLQPIRQIKREYLDYDEKTLAFLKTLHMLELFLKHSFGNINLPELLKNCQSNNSSLREELLKRYSLQPLKFSDEFNEYHNHEGRYDSRGYYAESWIDRKINNNLFNIFLDTPFGICLCYEGLPVAVSSFTVIDHETVLIRQLQGVTPIKIDANGNPIKDAEGNSVKNKRHATSLITIDWEKLLLTSIEKVSKQAGFKRIGIQGPCNNNWLQETDTNLTETHLTARQAERYCTTAQRLGFALSILDNNFYRVIQ